MSLPVPPSAAVSDRLHGLSALRGLELLPGAALYAPMAWSPSAQHFSRRSEAHGSLALSELFR